MKRKRGRIFLCQEAFRSDKLRCFNCGTTYIMPLKELAKPEVLKEMIEIVRDITKLLTPKRGTTIMPPMTNKDKQLLQKLKSATNELQALKEAIEKAEK